MQVHVLPALLKILATRLGAVGRGWMVLWHVGERQSVRHKAWHDKRWADSPVLTKGDSSALFPRIRDVDIGRHCPFDGKVVRW